jgi:ribokinase
MVKKFDVITMGSGLVDAFLDTGVKEKNVSICFPAGEKIRIKNLSFSTGGGGTNTAVSFAKLGLKTGFLGKTGSGYNAQIILRDLKKNKVDFIGKQSKERTGYSIILEGDKKNRTILTFKGASDNLKFSEISFPKIKTKWLYFTTMSNESFESQKKLALYAKKNNIKLAYNPSSYHTKHGAKFLSPILKNTHVLILNKEEAQHLTKGNLYTNLHKLGPKIVCITDGNKPGGVYDGHILYKFYPSKTKAQECTGAGDAFGSSFVAGLIKFNNIEKAIKLAMANSESVITQRGATHGLLSLPQVLKKINSHHYKIKKVDMQ